MNEFLTVKRLLLCSPLNNIAWNLLMTRHSKEYSTCCARSTGQEERCRYRILLHTFIQSCLFFLHISPLFISPLFLYLPVYISLVYISLVFISPPNPGPLTLLYSLSSTHRRPRPLTSHEASANQGSRGKSPPNWIHLYPGIPAQHSRCLCLIWGSQVQVIWLSCSLWRLWDCRHTRSPQRDCSASKYPRLLSDQPCFSLYPIL
jgi:hypothetical protein